MTNREKIEAAKEKFGALLEEQLARVERMKNEADFVNYAELDKIIIGVTAGGGISPAITKKAGRSLNFLL